MKLSALNEWIYRDGRDEKIGDDITDAFINATNSLLTGDKERARNYIQVLKHWSDRIPIDDFERLEYQRLLVTIMIKNIDDALRYFDETDIIPYLKKFFASYTELSKSGKGLS